MSTKHLEVLVVEDDQVLGISIKRFLQARLHLEVKLFFDSIQCIEYLSNRDASLPFCLVTDISLKQGSDGLLLIDILKEKKYNFTSIAMTGFASVETAIEATRKGVFQYLTKPFELEHLTEIVCNAIKEKYGELPFTSMPVRSNRKKKQLEKFNVALEYPNENDMFNGMIGRSESMKMVFDRIKKVSHADSTVLISGASGTGKELVANAIHDLSKRNTHSHISVNCGAIPADLLESELFGHIKGAFTGAISDRKGRFELADKGSIFLDEIGDMPLLLQVKLLRVLQQKCIEPVGGSSSKKVDVRIITATHRNLEKFVKEGKFREDLFYRLNVIPIRIPALRDRKEDIPLLMAYFLKRVVSANGSNEISFSDEAMQILMNYDWPGNVRELENLVERLVILKGGGEISPEDLPLKIHNAASVDLDELRTYALPEDGINLKDFMSDIEAHLIRQALDKTQGNKNQASKLLQLNRTTLIEKIKKRNLDIEIQ